MRLSALLAALFLATACQDSPTPDPVAHLVQGDRQLRVGDSVVIGAIPVRFTRVPEDSRCPVDVTCVWAGNAVVELAVGPPAGTLGPTHQLLLNTMLEPRTGEAWGYRITLLALRPEPVSGQPVPPGTYVAELKFEELAAPGE